MSTDDSPDTEEQLTSQDFIREGPIERGLQSHAEAFMAELTLGMHPEDARAVMTKLGARADMFKAMAFEADKEAKRLQARVTELEGLFDHQTATIAEHQRKEGVLRSALLDIEGRVQTWIDTHWIETVVAGPGQPGPQVLLSILAVVKRVK